MLITPANHLVHWQQDVFGNFMARVDFNGAVQELTIEVKLLAAMTQINPFDFFLDESARSFPFHYSAELQKYLQVYLEVTETGPVMMDWLEKEGRSSRGTIDS